MNLLTSNLQTVLTKNGQQLDEVLKQYKVEKVLDLTIENLESICKNEGIELENLMLYNLSFNREKVKNLKLLIVDVDGVMTDGGMYFTQKGDEIKKYNTKDGMGIIEAQKLGLQFGIISSGFKIELVQRRAELLRIEYFYVGREPKMDVLNRWCKELNCSLSEVGIIGDDINDLEVMRNVGFSAAPADAVPAVKRQVDIVLQKKGGEGCVRELIDYYLLEKPLER